MRNGINIDRAAMVLVEAIFYGDKATADRYGITTRTVENYRKRLKDGKNEKLSEVFYQKKTEFERDWVSEIPAAIRAGTRFLLRSYQEADHTDAAVIHAVAGAMKILTEIGLAKEIIDVRLSEYNRSYGETSNEMATVSQSSR